MKPDRIVLIEWLEKAKDAEPGEIIYVYCEDKHRQRAMAQGFQEELSILAKIAPKKAATIAVVPVFKDRMHWIALKKSGVDPETGFFKDADGNISRIKISAQSLLDRRVKRLMTEDGICEGVIELDQNTD